MTTAYVLMPTPLWYLVDTTGQPLAGGSIQTFRSLNKAVEKPVYQDAAGLNAWPNPLFFGLNGQSPGAIYWADDEPYFIIARDSSGNIVWTDDNFQANAGGGGGSNVTIYNNLTNYIVNNTFWRNIGSVSGAGGFNTDLVIAPGAHDGISSPDITFFKNANSATDTITFVEFNAGDIPMGTDVTPIYYINYVSSSGSGETQKWFKFPITANAKNLEQLAVTATIWAQNASGNTNLQLSFLQNFGEGSNSPSADVVTPISTPIATDGTWTEYNVTANVPSVAAKTFGNNSPGYVALLVGMPTAAATEMNFTKPSLYIGSNFPDIDYDIFDRTNAVISSPRTGDIRTSLNSFAPWGWVALNDGTIGNTSSGATRSNLDTYELFKLIWANVSNTYAPIYDSSGAPSSRTTASADYAANKRLSLTKALGRVLSGANTTPTPIVSKAFTGTSSGGLLITVDDGSSFYRGTQVQVSGASLPPGLSAGVNYYVAPVPSTAESANTFLLCPTLANAIDYTNGIPFGGTGSGTIFTINTAHALGSYVGEDTHALFEAQTPAHSHALTGSVTASTPNPYFYSVGGGQPLTSGGGANEYKTQSTVSISNTLAVANSTPNDQVHNNIQPSVYMNYFMKL